MWVWMGIYLYLTASHSINHPVLRMKIPTSQESASRPDIPPTVHIREMLVRAADLAVYLKLTVDLDAGLHFPSQRHLAPVQVQSQSSWLHTAVLFQLERLLRGRTYLLSCGPNGQWQ